MRAAASDAPRVVVLPARWLTEGNTLEVALDGAMEALERAPVHATRAPSASECAEDVSCIRGLGRDEHATHVLAIELAGLGQTMIVRVRLIESREAGGDVVRQRVVDEATRERVEQTLREMTAELVAPLVPAPEPERAWYERGYVYVIGVGLVAGAIGTGIGVHRYREGRPDVVIVPP